MATSRLVILGSMLLPACGLLQPAQMSQLRAARASAPLPCRAPHAAAMCSRPPPEDDDSEPAPPPLDVEAEYEAGLAFGKSLRDRFLRPRIDDPGLPYADALVCICGALFVASLGLVGGIPRPSWLFALLPPGVEPIRGLPYIVPAFSHGTGLAACWLLGALAASAFESDAYTGTLREALARTWKAGAFATGVLLLGAQANAALQLLAMGVDPLAASREADRLTITTAFEVITDVLVQATGLTAFRIYRWYDAQQYSDRR